MNEENCDGYYAPLLSSFILPTSSLDLRHAKINKDSKLESVAGRHLCADLNSDLDFSNPQRVWGFKPFREKASFEGALC